jgi:hypothetical protein
MRVLIARLLTLSFPELLRTTLKGSFGQRVQDRSNLDVNVSKTLSVLAWMRDIPSAKKVITITV